MLALCDLTPFLLNRLQAEYQHRWIGPALLPIAGAIRELGGNFEDYERLVRMSNLWLTYTTETTNNVATQEKNLVSAWEKSKDHGDWDLADALSNLAARVRSFNRWPNPRTASRDRLVALAFIGFCLEHNCFTRTLSQYELAKMTGLSRKTVARALASLIELGLLIPQDEYDRKSRATRRYRLYLRWNPAPELPHGGRPGEVCPDDPRNTCIRSLGHVVTHTDDVWVRRGLGATAARVYELLTDEAVPVKALASRVGLDRSTVSKHLARLFDHGLAGYKSEGKSKLWFRGEAPLDLIAEALGVDGTLERHVQKIELMQADQRALKAMPFKDRQIEYRKRRDAALRCRAERAISLGHLPTDESDALEQFDRQETAVDLDPFEGPGFNPDHDPEPTFCDWGQPELTQVAPELGWTYN